MKRIYISSRITGDPDCRAKFRDESERLGALGYRPVSPAEIVADGESWESAMRAALRAMLTCDGVSLASGLVGISRCRD